MHQGIQQQQLLSIDNDSNDIEQRNQRIYPIQCDITNGLYNELSIIHQQPSYHKDDAIINNIMNQLSTINNKLLDEATVQKHSDS